MDKNREGQRQEGERAPEYAESRRRRAPDRERGDPQSGAGDDPEATEEGGAIEEGKIVEESALEARQGISLGRVRFVLLLGLILAALGSLLAYLLAR